MKRARLLAFLLIPLVAGCDIAVVAVLASRKSGGSKSPFVPPPPDVSYFVWVANLGAGTEAAEATAIEGTAGNPGAGWTLLTSATSSGDFAMPAPGPFNSVLVQVTSAQAYDLDAFEILDATGTTTATPAALFADTATTAGVGPATGTPNGLTAPVTTATANKAFVFFRHTAAITTFRINIWKPAARGEGDVEWVREYDRNNDTAGGAAVSDSGRVYLTFREGINIWLLRYLSDGSIEQDSLSNDLTQVENNTTTTAGSASVVVASGTEDVYIAATRNAGDIRLYKFVGTTAAPVFSPTVVMQPGVDRVEPNGLAIRSNGELVLAGGADFGGLNGVGHYLRSFRASDGGDRWGTSTTPAVQSDLNGAPTYWYAVTTFGTNDIFTTGNLSQTLGVGPVDIYTARTVDNSQTTSTVTETWNERVPSAPSNMAIGRAVGADSSGNAYVAGFYTHTDLDSVILKYLPAGPAANVHVDLRRAGNDEYLDIVVEADGTIYAVGYETNTDEDLVLVKIRPNNSIEWKRTLDRGVGNDRGVSVCTTATRVIVVGEVTVGAGNKDIHVRSYVK